MSSQVTLKINGQDVTVEKGTRVIEAAKLAGAEIAHFCYHPKLKPDANCRMCLVEIEKMPKLQTSCSTEVSEGMVVETASEKVVDAQKGVMAFLLGNHPLDCPECDQGGECQLQDFAHQHGAMTSPFGEVKRTFEKSYFGPLIEKEMNRCVSCLRCVRYCDEVIGANALGSMNRGAMHEVGAFARQELACEFCGGCIQICPVGALTSRLAMFDYRTWQLKKTESICNYCGDGCTLTLEAAKEEITRVSSEMGTGRNSGDLCARGFFGYGAINHESRLMRPLLRLENGDLEVTWQWAFDKTSEDLKAIVEKYGAKAVGGVISAQCTNEAVYLFQKLMRETIGTPHIDSGARFGYINAVSALTEVFGTARLASYEDIVESDCLLVFAGEMTETNPIAALKVKEAIRQNRAKLITVSPYNARRETYISHLPHLAHQHLQVQVGSESSAILGLTKAILEAEPASATPQAMLAKMKTAVSGISFESIEAASGISESQFQKAAALFRSAKRGVLIVGRSVLRGAEGHEAMLRLSELAVISGQIGRPGCGILPLSKESNAFGALEMGGAPEFLPGLQPSDPENKGYNLLEMVDAAARGEIKALYLVGENPLRSLPQKKVKAALENLELLICQDLYPTETTALAQIVLPASSYAEQSGRFTNQEGEIQKLRPAIDPVGNSKPDWEIFSTLTGKLNTKEKTPYQKLRGHVSADAVWKEAVMAMPEGWSTQKGAKPEALSAYAENAQIAWQLPEKTVQDGLFALQVGQSLFHAGQMSTYASGLTTLLNAPVILIHPEDAERLSLDEGEQVQLSTEDNKAGIQLPVKTSKKIAEGTLFVSEHFALSVKTLLPLSVDKTTGVPAGDSGWVALSKISVAAS
ncbi:NADH-ubiquinone oxidoreductase chain G [hydrothermal vent metagenome]|uniref:NADH-ubiquinone oxidoreductase chain G n=1 Tax=hydrothermal vent metagenome TaxID=652676 RepID=A0A3B1D9D9_9ZZZZ